MDSHVYKEHIDQEETHWWFVSRRAITRYILNKVQLPANAKILDAGCGAGGNLPLLANYGEVFACEMNDQVREHSIKRNIGTVVYGRFPDDIPFADQKFDLIAMFDVLEHIEDDNATLAAIAAKLSDGGKILLTVPAFQFLFSRHDRQHHHFRRYSKKELLHKIKQAGLNVEFVNYWNFFLFPVAVATRLGDYFSHQDKPVLGAQTPSRIVNSLLIWLVSLERFLNKIIKLPFGLSLIVVASKA